MKYIIGFDCGATKSEFAAADLSGKILLREEGGPANFLVIGVERASTNVVSLVKKCSVKLNSPEFEIIVIGAAGAGRKEDAEKLRKILAIKLKAKKIVANSIKVIGDHEIALKAAFPNSPGCILIAGTGSIIYGKDSKNKIHRIGGFGKMIGDEGSGHSIGRKGLQAVSKHFDGRNKNTKILELLDKKHRINSSDELIKKVYKENFDVASVAEIVLTAAAKKDRTALRILDEESDELIDHIKAILQKMRMKKIKISIAGSLLTNKNVYSNMLKKKIKDSLPSVKIVKPKFSPVEGAILIAKEMLSD